MLPVLATSPGRFGQGLLRGRSMAAAVVVENNAVPVDGPFWCQFIEHWDRIMCGLIEVVDQDFSVY